MTGCVRKHINVSQKKINKAFIARNCRKQNAQSTFLSVLDHGDVIYVHSPDSSLEPFNAVYHWALRHQNVVYYMRKLGGSEKRQALHFYLFTKHFLVKFEDISKSGIICKNTC